MVNLLYSGMINRKMVRNLSRRKKPESRRKALDSTERLEDFVYKDNSTADITDSENERQHQIAEEIQYEHLMRHHLAEDLLKGSDDVINYDDKINWLKKLGYEGVNIKGYAKAVPFENAINAGYGRNVNSMFFKEKERLTKIRDESARYLF